MMAASQRAHRLHAPNQNHPGRNKRKGGTTVTSRSRPASALDHAVRVVHSVCCLAGSASLIDDLRAELRAEGVPSAIRRHDTATLFDWLVAAFSYQGISDQVAFDYMERHGRARGPTSTCKPAPGTTCPKLQATGTSTAAGTTRPGHCAEPDHLPDCPCPTTSCATVGSTRRPIPCYLFIRDIADGDLVGWIDRRLHDARQPEPDRLARMRAALLDPLREVYGVSDKVLTMTLSCVLLAAPRRLDRLARSRRQHDRHRHPGAQLSAPHRDPGTGSVPTIPTAPAATGRAAAPTLLARSPSRSTPAVQSGVPATFPRFVQHAIWRYCAQLGLDVCNGNRIDDRQSCDNVYCQIRRRCDRISLNKHK